MIPYGYTRRWFKFDANKDGGSTGSSDAKFSDADVKELESYRQLGWSAEDINLALTDYARMAEEKNRPAKETKAPAKDDDHVDLEKMDPKVRAELFKLVPELKRLSKIDELERKQAEQEQSTKQLKQSGFQDMQSSSRKDVLYYYQDKLHGDTSSEEGRAALNAVLSTVSDYIGSDAKMLQRFMDGDKRVTEDALQALEREGRFKYLSIPKVGKASKRTLPGMFGHDGDAEEIRNIAETNKEKYAKFSPTKRWAEMSKDTYNNIWKED